MKTLLFASACAAALVLAGCSSDSSTGSGSTGTGTTTGGSTTGGTSTGGTTGGATVNGCTAATAQDFTGQATAHVTISGFSYTPACIKVSTTTAVTIDTSAAHPLAGGNDCVAATSGNPISGTATQPFTFTTPGSYGFFCQNHCASNDMKGAVFVQ